MIIGLQDLSTRARTRQDLVRAPEAEIHRVAGVQSSSGGEASHQDAAKAGEASEAEDPALVVVTGDARAGKKAAPVTERGRGTGQIESGIGSRGERSELGIWSG